MTSGTDHMTDAELAEYYDTNRDADEWGEPVPVERGTRRDVTISVRFSGEEIAAIRDLAHRLGVKPTAYIRAAALHGGISGQPDAVAVTAAAQRLDTVLADIADVRHTLTTPGDAAQGGQGRKRKRSRRKADV